MREKLDLMMITGRYSGVLVDQLAWSYVNRVLNVWTILDEIGSLEGAPSARPTRTKSPTEFKRPPLTGLWHKHFFQARFMAQNVLNHWRRKDLKAVVNAIVNDSTLSDRDKIGAIAQRFVKGGHEDRMAASEMTGEWIVYARQDDKNYFLTLAGHQEPGAAALRRVLLCRVEFPELTILADLATSGAAPL